MPRIRLIAASDDYLLEERLDAAVAEVSAELGGVEPEVQGSDATPESVATELVSPSLFAAERLLVVPDAREWLGAPPPAGFKQGDETALDAGPLLEVIAGGVPDGMALVMGAWCGRKPGGTLVEAIDSAGSFLWIPLPPRPKPWEDAILSDQQFYFFRGLIVFVMKTVCARIKEEVIVVECNAVAACLPTCLIHRESQTILLGIVSDGKPRGPAS